MKKKALVLPFLMIHAHASAQFNTIIRAPKIYEIENISQDFLYLPTKVAVVSMQEDERLSSEAVPSTSDSDSLRHKYIMQYMSVSLPLKKIKVNSPFGLRKDPFNGKKKGHNGLDLYARSDEVYAMFGGVVKKTGYDKKSGNFVTLQHGEYTISYCHLSQIWLKKNDRIRPGDIVGITGSTGRSTGEHLHITTRRNGKYINPYFLIQYINEVKDNSIKFLCK